MDKNKNSFPAFLYSMKIESLSSEEITTEISLKVFDEEYNLYERENFDRLPILMRDIVSFTIFDTCCAMDSLWSFFETASYDYYEDVIHAFERMGLEEEAETMRKITHHIVSYHRTHIDPHSKSNDIPYILCDFEQEAFENMMEEVFAIGAEFDDSDYLYDALFLYIDKEKEHLINELKSKE